MEACQCFDCGAFFDQEDASSELQERDKGDCAVDIDVYEFCPECGSNNWDFA